jgi:lysozyme
MARGRRKSARGGPRRWLVRLVALAVLLGLAFAAWLWWDMREWRPDAALYPEQGALLPADGTPVKFETLKAVGAQFVYLPCLIRLRPAAASALPNGSCSAQAAGLKVGVVLDFDPCITADAQSGAFAQMVPRDAGLLPPAIGLARLADGCDPKVSDAAVESELMTLINQIEMHSGQAGDPQAGPCLSRNATRPPPR